ncbi:type II toxin-antitoxin system RelE family toxin [Argonema antarcticum]|uniref:type II toxin-antitoxin system RelE family toxin n=1 Tax=Argonema antarcticum TaxID=2942763 RepID=UPI002011EEAB|nr:type II toxin-antitoxin system RelE/ParE family toxin [Argonema antarcticum]MCL1474389.1 type II toxin-antitoxin system RelE/ParE family toxin [Argonema antarcticum A004/B2]
MYELVPTRKAQTFYEQADLSLVERLNRCFDGLRQNPYQHPNIKRLKGSFAGCFRYSVGDWRVVYQVDEAQQLITILLIAPRGSVYR